MNNATAFAKMKTIYQPLVLSPGTVRAAANATVAISVATTMPNLAISLVSFLTLSDNV